MLELIMLLLIEISPRDLPIKSEPQNDLIVPVPTESQAQVRLFPPNVGAYNPKQAT